jgi:hypothetical protein
MLRVLNLLLNELFSRPFKFWNVAAAIRQRNPILQLI